VRYEIVLVERAEPAVNLSETRAESALLEPVDRCVATPILAAQEALSLFVRRSRTGASADRG
jgi:hypothetical protein